MGQHIDIEQVDIITDALGEYQGFTSGEKQFCTEHLEEWFSKENSLDLMISDFSEKSLDVKPFLEKIGLLK